MTDTDRFVARFVTSAKASTDARALANSGWTRIDVIVDAIAIVVGFAFVASGQSLGFVLVVLALVALASTRWHPLQRWIVSWRFRSFLGKPTVVTIDDEGVRFANEVGTSVVPWAAVTDIRSNDITTIFVRDRAMLGYIPADAFPSEQTRSDFIEFARGRLAAEASDPATEGSKGNRMSARDDVAAFNAAFSAAMAAQDVDAVVASYTEGAKLLFEGSPIIEGRAAIEAYLGPGLRKRAMTIAFESIEVFDGGSFVVDVGRLTTPTGTGKYIVVHERQLDGSLKMAIDSATGDGSEARQDP